MIGCFVGEGLAGELTGVIPFFMRERGGKVGRGAILVSTGGARTMGSECAVLGFFNCLWCFCQRI